MELLTTYKNGNYQVKLYDDGTKIKTANDGFFNAEFPDSIDLKITNYCDMNCPMCHENSSLDGAHADLDLDFIDTLPSGIELAIGGGNPLSHPKLLEFLIKLKEKNVITNLTVNEKHLLGNLDLVQNLLDCKFIYGLGVSLTEKNPKTFDFARKNSSVVFHLILGVTCLKDLRLLYNQNHKILLLGYKKFGRGVDNYSFNITRNIDEIENNFDEIRGKFKVVSFDNLALRQLKVKEKVTPCEWQRLYMGDDGESTMYIDLVKKEFAVCSTATTRFEILPDIKSMFKIIKKESKFDKINAYAVFTKDKEDEKSFNVIFPGVFPTVTCGEGFEDALFMAKDCLKTVYESFGITEFEDTALFTKEKIKELYPDGKIVSLNMAFKKAKMKDKVYEVCRRGVFETNSSGTHSITVVNDNEKMVRITDVFDVFDFLIKKFVDNLSKSVIEVFNDLKDFFNCPNITRETLLQIINLSQINKQTVTEILGDVDFENDDGRFDNSVKYIMYKDRYLALSEDVNKLFNEYCERDFLCNDYVKMTKINQEKATEHLNSFIPKSLDNFVLNFDKNTYLKSASLYSNHSEETFDSCFYNVSGITQYILSGQICLYKINESPNNEELGYMLKNNSSNVSKKEKQFDLLIYTLASYQIHHKHTIKGVYKALKEDNFGIIEPNAYQLILNVYLEQTNAKKENTLESIKQVAKKGQNNEYGLCFGLFDGDMFYSKCEECTLSRLTDGFHSLKYCPKNYLKIRKEIEKIFNHKKILFSTEY